MQKEFYRRGIGIVAVILIIFSFLRIFNPWAETAGEKNIRKARQVMAQGLARKVAERYPDSRIVVLVADESTRDRENLAGISELTAQLLKSLNRRGLQVETRPCPMIFPEAPAAANQSLPEDLDRADLIAEEEAQWGGESPTADSNALVDLLNELNDRADAVVITIPLDYWIRPRDLPKKGKAPPLVLMHPPVWPDMGSAMQDTALDLVLLYRAETSQLVTKRWPRDDKVAFDQRFYFATATDDRPANLSGRK